MRLEDQVPDAEATQRVIAAYQHLDADEKHLLWLALAAAQSLAHGTHATSGDGRTLASQGDSLAWQDGLLEVEIRDDGGVRLLVGRMTDVWRDQDVRVIFDGLAVVYSMRLAVWAARVAVETGYRGSWRLGIHCTDLRGLQSFHASQAMSPSAMSAYSEASYREVTTATGDDLTDRPVAVSERLTGRLVWALGTDDIYARDLPGWRSADPDGGTSNLP